MNPLTTDLELEQQQMEDDRLRKAGQMTMDEYARRLGRRKFERQMTRITLSVFIRWEAK